MAKFIVWADGGEKDAFVMEAVDRMEAAEHGSDTFGVSLEEISTIEAENTRAAEHYGVAHALEVK